MEAEWDIVVVGSGNAAMSAALAAQQRGCRVLVIEKAQPDLAGGNTAYTAGAMRFVYSGIDDLLPLLEDPSDPRLARTDFGQYTVEQFEADLLGFNNGRPLSSEQRTLIDDSYDAVRWLASHGVRFEPIYSRQSFEKDGRFVFWGGLTLATRNEGFGLVEAEHQAFRSGGGEIRLGCAAVGLIVEDGAVVGVRISDADGSTGEVRAHAVVLACGGFESNAALRRHYLGEGWELARVRGTPHNLGQGLEMAFGIGAKPHGFFGGCHATPMDRYTPDFGNLDLPHLERKHYRKICYFLGVMLNADGERFVDEGQNFRNYTYAQFGRAIMRQPKHLAWQIFDAKVDHLLYSEYHFHDAHYLEAETLDKLIAMLDELDGKAAALETIAAFNRSVDARVPFDPTAKDGKGTIGLPLPKSNWALPIDTPPFKAYPVTGGITFTYGGVEVSRRGGVVHENGHEIPGLFACGEMVGGVFFDGYPGGSGLTSGVVFGRRAGGGAAERAAEIKGHASAADAASRAPVLERR